MSDSPHGTTAERRSFQYFRRLASVEFTGPFISEFWSRLVLQAVYADLAVWHAIIAVASEHEAYYSKDRNGSSVSPAFAIQQYTKAISLLQRRLSTSTSDDQSSEIALICCLLFITFESLRGCHNSAYVHLRNGLCILARLVMTSRTSGTVMNDLVPVFLRLSGVFG